MEILMVGNVDDVNCYNSKNGFGCNVKISQLKDNKRKDITFNVKSPALAEKFESNLQKNVSVKIVLDQNNFGLRFGDVLEVGKSN